MSFRVADTQRAVRGHNDDGVQFRGEDFQIIDEALRFGTVVIIDTEVADGIDDKNVRQELVAGLGEDLHLHSLASRNFP